MIEPTPEQRAILDVGPGPLRISAGAGTGKTTTVAVLVCDLVDRHGIDPEEIVGITFTNKAAAELADRIRTLIAPRVGPGREPEVHTYHGFAAQLIGEFGALVGVERGASVITPTFSRQILFDVIQNRRFVHFDPVWKGSVDKVQRLGAAMGDHLVDPAALAADAGPEPPWPERLELLAAWSDYQAEKDRLGVVDYSDLIASTVRLLERHPEVGERIRSRYRAVLLDEYQDTNPAQRIMLQRLFGAGFPVVAVGDTDQTIYEWRGATPDNFAGFPDHFPHADGSPATERHLTINRRSDRHILAVANQARRQISTEAADLQPMPAAADGRVGVRWATDAVAEASWIADEVVRLHERGTPWKEIAVLFRKNRHIAIVHDALAEREIPVEVANLGGLLSVPEVADIRAWMRILHSPEDGPAVLRILMGPRFGLGMGDLVPLARWARRAEADPEGDGEISLDHEGLPRHTMLEAIDHVGEIEALPERARGVLERFRGEYRHLLEAAQGSSLAELARTIVDVTRTWGDIEAMGPAGRLSARLNLYRFLDLAEEWSPLEGRPSLPAFLAHLEVMEDNPADELDAARISGEDAVALLTVHRAKGLEWDAVFIPAVTKANFPATSSGFENPYLRAQWLPHGWRKDTPPPFDETTPEKDATAILRQRHLTQEWRTAYVAVTRARHRLYLSGAHWYGATTPNQRPAVPSELYELVADMPFTSDLGTHPQGERPDVLRAPDRVGAPDPLFPDGWAAAMRAAIADVGVVAALAEERGIAPAVNETADNFAGRLFDLGQIPSVAPEPAAPSTSVTGLVTYAACPRRFFWTDVDRLPRRPSPAARRGVEVHRRIELHGLGHVPMAEADPDAYDMVPGEMSGRGADGDPFTRYLDSEYGRRRPLMVEVPFEFATAAGVGVRGRIDAVYPRGGGWEIVDFKSGRRRDESWLQVQLQAYALAAERVDFGRTPPESLCVSFVYLGGSVEVQREEVDEAWMTVATTSVEGLAAGIADGRYAPLPSIACRSCEFVRFCPPGAAWLEDDPV